MAFSADSLAPFIQRLNEAGHCYVGYSGGLDSHVLLHSLRSLLPPQKITAIHINHQLSVNAGQWVEHCQRVCEDLGIELVTDRVQLKDGSGSTEELAREARYAVFESIVGEDDVLLLAHHLDDQAETIIYRLLRGSGPLGLSGIPQQRQLGKGVLIRPLLGSTRTELHDYAVAERLNWVEDDSNRNQQFDRNFIRHRLMPVIAERWPDYRQRLSHSAQLSSQASGLLDYMAQQDLDSLELRQERLGCSVNCQMLLALPATRQANLLRLWIKQQNMPVPGHRIIHTIMEQAERSGEEASLQVEWKGAVIRKYRQRLFLLPAFDDSQSKSPEVFLWSLGETLELPDGSLLSAQRVLGSGLKFPQNESLRVAFRQGGERCKPVGRAGSNNLKTLFQEYSLEPWLRSHVPLLFSGESLAAVGDLWVCEPFAAQADEYGYQLSWQYGH